MKKLFLSLVTAALGTLLLYAVTQSPGGHWLDGLVLLGWFAGSAGSGNAHAPNEIVVWTTVFLIIALATMLLLLGARLAAAAGDRAILVAQRLRGHRDGTLKH